MIKPLVCTHLEGAAKSIEVGFTPEIVGQTLAMRLLSGLAIAYGEREIGWPEGEDKISCPLHADCNAAYERASNTIEGASGAEHEV